MADQKKYLVDKGLDVVNLSDASVEDVKSKFCYEILFFFCQWFYEGHF